MTRHPGGKREDRKPRRELLPLDAAAAMTWAQAISDPARRAAVISSLTGAQ
jgi:hypothetical protein